MFKPRFSLLIFFIVLSLAWLSSFGIWKRYKTRHTSTTQYNLKLSSFEKARSKAAEVRQFVIKKGYNDAICFLVDMSLPSGQNRFFVYNLTKDTLQNSALVAHGRCNDYWLQGRKYGNTVGCGCTSLGKYKVGYSYNDRFGLAYKLYGLDKTNSNAFKRYVVMHAHDCVPET